MIDPSTLPPRHGRPTGQAPEDRLRPAIHDFADATKEVVDDPPEPVLGLGPWAGHDDTAPPKSQSFGRLV